MLSVLLNWIYVAITTFCLGSGFSVFSEKVFGYRLKRIDTLLMTGLIIATVYAQFFSLFGGVGLVANVILVAGCVLIVVFCGKSMAEILVTGWRNLGPEKKVLVLIISLVWAYCTSRGLSHYDTDLYHAQSIRWIEEYGVVYGLGNLHARFAYNSSFFALNALYSMKFLVGQSLHTLSGYFALLLSIIVLDITKSWKRRRLVLGDFARVAAIYYLTIIVDEVVSPASDYAIMCMVFYIVIKWLGLLEKEEKSIVPYALLCVACVYALTIKLTAGLILLLLIKPARQLLKEKKIRDIFLYLGMGLLVAIPWFARTVVISGWLFYPFPALDLFNVDWKIPKMEVVLDAAEISMWGKGLRGNPFAEVSITQWIPNWFLNTLSNTEKLLILGNVLGIVLFIAGLMWIILKKKWQYLDFALVLGAVVCSYLFWQMSAPLLRYGYAYVLLVDFLVFGWVLVHLGWSKVETLVYGIVLVVGCYKLFMVSEYIYQTRVIECYIWQSDYNRYQVEGYEVAGVTFYKPVEGDRTGYEPFPAAPFEARIELRGDGIEDGFRRIKE